MLAHGADEGEWGRDGGHVTPHCFAMKVSYAADGREGHVAEDASQPPPDVFVASGVSHGNVQCCGSHDVVR